MPLLLYFSPFAFANCTEQAPLTPSCAAAMRELATGAARAALERAGAGRAARRGADGRALHRLPGRAREARVRAARRVPLHPHAALRQGPRAARQDRRAARRALLGYPTVSCLVTSWPGRPPLVGALALDAFGLSSSGCSYPHILVDKCSVLTLALSYQVSQVELMCANVRVLVANVRCRCEQAAREPQHQGAVAARLAPARRLQGARVPRARALPARPRRRRRQALQGRARALQGAHSTHLLSPPHSQLHSRVTCVHVLVRVFLFVDA